MRSAIHLMDTGHQRVDDVCSVRPLDSTNEP